MSGTVPFEFTKNYKFTVLNNENVWAKAANRVLNEKVPVDKAVDEMIARIKTVQCRHQPHGRPKPRSLPAMSTILAAPTNAAVAAPARRAAATTWEFWGACWCCPTCWCSRCSCSTRWATGCGSRAIPSSYVEHLFADPIFFRTVINTLIFLVVAINIKMVIALVLSGFFVQSRWWIKALSVLFILPWAVPSIPTILSVRFMLNPEWGVINTLIFRFTGMDGPNWLNDPTLALSSRC
jgi:ABC-type sugar transport system permease subunit